MKEVTEVAVVYFLNNDNGIELPLKSNSLKLAFLSRSIKFKDRKDRMENEQRSIVFFYVGGFAVGIPSISVTSIILITRLLLIFSGIARERHCATLAIGGLMMLEYDVTLC